MSFVYPINSPREIEAAAEALSPKDNQELLRFLAMQIRGNRIQPKLRLYSDQELASILAKDEAHGQLFRQGT